MQMRGLNVAAVFIFYHFNAKNLKIISVLQEMPPEGRSYHAGITLTEKVKDKVFLHKIQCMLTSVVFSGRRVKHFGCLSLNWSHQVSNSQLKMSQSFKAFHSLSETLKVLVNLSLEAGWQTQALRPRSLEKNTTSKISNKQIIQVVLVLSQVEKTCQWNKWELTKNKSCLCHWNEAFRVS